MPQPYYTDDSLTLFHGDCLDVLRTLPDCSVDSVVTDPPYELTSGKGSAGGFMGKRWDGTGIACNVDLWAEVLRVLKPGGHCLAFGGSRTWHRLAVAVEDAGFEIRDSIFWHYGSGMPKSLNVSKALDGKRCSCAVPYIHEDVSREDVSGVRNGMGAGEPVSVGTESDVLEAVRERASKSEDGGQAIPHGSAADDSLRGVLDAREDPAGMGEAQREDLLLTPVQRRGAGQGVGEARPQGVEGAHPRELQGGSHARGEEPGMERRSDFPAREGELHRGEVRPMPREVEGDGARRRLHSGAPASDGRTDRQAAIPSGSRGPRQSQPEGQQAGESGAVPDERGSQTWGGWPVCGRCLQPVVPDGLGTGLKPATEPIVLARKPLAGTVAQTVLAYGTGALNIGASRIGTDGGSTQPSGMDRLNAANAAQGYRPNTYAKGTPQAPAPAGRWPANVVLDEDQAAALDQQTGHLKGGVTVRRNNSPGQVESNEVFGRAFKRVGPDVSYGDCGGASRFYYVAKAPKSERPKVDGVSHPTVKPLTLLRYLARLVTPPGGTILDMFAGSGTLGEAAALEGFKAILCEREAEYLPLILARAARAVQANLPTEVSA